MFNPVLDQDRVQFLRARQGAGNKKMLLPAWPRPEKELLHVSLEATWIRFSTLNHRTRSEQMRIVNQQARPDLFTSDPLGPEAQAEQYRILVAQEGFQDLRSDLKERGQQQHAVVTAEGVLINGNRRAAALRSLFLEDDHKPSRYVSCLVLPDDANPREMVDLETELQIAREFKEDYTWVNEALLIEEVFEREGKNWNKVSSRMHMDASEVRAQYEKLQQLHQLVAMSNGTRHHADFVANESAFTELAKHVKGKPTEETTSVRAAYFLGTLTGVNYRTLRDLRRPDASMLVWREIENDSALSTLLNPSTDPETEESDILDEVLGEQDVQGAGNLTSVLSYFAQQGQNQEIDIDGTKVSIGDIKASLKNAIDNAAEEARDQSKDESTVLAPVRQLHLAIRNIERAYEVLPKARALEDWQEEEYAKQVSKLKEVLNRLGLQE